MTAEITQRSLRFTSAALALTFLFYACGPPPAVPETLPDRLTDPEFWNMVTDFSEPGGYFPSDNFLSNESRYQEVIPGLLKTQKRGGAYIGVGPEQNFTYIVALQPKIAFIIDIRRQNMLEHLFYKALMETSADRAEFLSRLFARPAVEGTAASTPEALFRACKAVRPSPAFFETNMRRVVEYLENDKGFELSEQDRAGIRHVAQAFFKSGPDLSYSFIGGNHGNFRRMPSYSDLMTESDGVSRNWNFLATEDQFQAIRRMQKSNLIVPLVGDFAGAKAIRSVAEYVQQHGSTVRAFYTSNVEQYLFQDDNWKHFYGNVAFLPADSSSAFIRYVLNGGPYGRQRTSLTSPIASTLRRYRAGVIRSYYDVVSLSR